MSRRGSQCRRCGYHKELTRHHVLPRRWFFGRGKKILLCNTCHVDIERIIFADETKIDRHPHQQSEAYYYLIAESFCTFMCPVRALKSINLSVRMVA